MIRAVIFDLDDTLFPEEQFVMSGFRAVDEWLKNHHGVTDFYTSSEQLFREGRRGNIFNLVLNKIGVVHDHEYIQELIKIYREHKPGIHLHEDAQWAIDHFRQSKKIGMITDGYLITQRNKVAALKIADYFDVIVYSDEFGRENWKPSKLPYQKIMDAIDCCGDECVYIADNPVKDFVTAKKLGWKTIQICRENGEYAHICPDKDHEPDTRITSLRELERLIL